MKLIYQVTYELDIDEEHLMGLKPDEFLEESMEDDAVSLLDTSVILKHKLLKVSKGSKKKELEEEDDDDLTVLDEEELDFEE
jgi:hypothetical protein